MMSTTQSLISLLVVAVLSTTEASQHYYTDPAGVRRRNYHFSNTSINNYVSDYGFVKNTGLDKLEPLLTQVYKKYQDDAQTFSASSLSAGRKFPHATNGKVLVDVIGEDESISTNLKDSVLYIDLHGCFKHVCSVRVPVQNLVSLSRIPGVRQIRSSMPRAFKGSVTSGGVADLNVDAIQESLGLNGTGMLICVISDSFDCLGGAEADIASGDLPSNVNVVKEYMESDCADEGRAMLQLIHDVAPGANLAFRTGFEGAADMATGITELADLGCDIIVDDIGYYTEPFFQDGMIAQAANAAAERGIPFFSAAGNIPTSQSWVAEGFVDAGVRLTIEDQDFGAFHSFGTDESGSPILFQPIGDFDTTNALGTESILLALQWDEPFFSANGIQGSASDLDIFIFELQEGRWQPSAGSFAINTGGDASELVEYSFANVTEPLVTLGMAISLADGSPPPGYMNVISVGDVEVSFTFPTFSASCIGHPNAVNTAGVGAAATGQAELPPVVQDYSTGGTPIFFDTSGNRLDEPEIRMQPRFVGPDETATTFFSELTEGGDFIFPGTSAAAPHIAAVAALMLQRQSDLGPLELYGILQDTAVDMDDPGTADFDVGFDFATGYGYVDARAALNALIGEVTPAPTPAIVTTPLPTAESTTPEATAVPGPEATPSPTFEATPLPTIGDTPTAVPATEATPSPTIEATPLPTMGDTPTAVPTPEATPLPTIGEMPEATPTSKSAKASKSAKSASSSSKSAKSASYSGSSKSTKSSKSRRRLRQEY